MFGLALIAVLVIMGGLIAYIGDKLGSKVGKRKLTIFGLRPKHTSILVTIVTGIIIAASTLGVLSVSSRDVRTALFGMEALKAQLSGLSQEVVAKSGELDASRMALETKTKEYSALTLKITETTTKLAQITEELSAVTSERDRTAAALQAVQRDYSLAKGDLDKAAHEITALQTTKQELDTKVASLNTARDQLQTDVDRLNELTANLKNTVLTVREGVVIYRAGEVISTSVMKGGQPSTETEQVLASIISRSNQLVLDKMGITDRNTEALFITRADFDQAVALVGNTAENVIVRVMSIGNIVYGEPVVGRLALYPNRLVYSAGDVVSHGVFDATSDAKQAEDTVLSFLQQVNAQAIASGVLPDPLRGTVGVMSGSQVFETVNKIKNHSGKVELIAVTKNDIYTAGPLYIDIRVHSVQ